MKNLPVALGLIRDEGLDIPIVGVAKSGWGLDQLRKRAKDSLAHHGVVDKPAQDKLLSLLRYIDGDYADPKTFSNLHDELGEAKRPLHYLAVPPSLFKRTHRGQTGTRFGRPRQAIKESIHGIRRTQGFEPTRSEPVAR